MTLAQLNPLPRDEFVRVVGPVFEHSPWIAEATCGETAVCQRGGFARGALPDGGQSASEDKQLALIRAHPDLVGQARVGRATHARIHERTGERGAGQSRRRRSRCSKRTMRLIRRSSDFRSSSARG